MTNAAPCLFSVCEERFDFDNAKAEKNGRIRYAHRFSHNYRLEFNPDAGRVIDDITTKVWSPAAFYGGIRKEANFKCSSVLGLDFDNGLTLGEAMDKFRRYRHVIGTTRSHSEKCHRFRVLIKLDKVVTDAGEYRNIVSHYINRFRSDPSCKDCARFYYPCTKIIRINPGVTLSSSVPLTETRDKQRVKKNWQGKKAKLDVLPLHICNFLANGFLFGGGRNVSCFVSAHHLRKIGVDLREAIYSVSSSPFDRKGFSDKELVGAVRSAYRLG